MSRRATSSGNDCSRDAYAAMGRGSAAPWSRSRPACGCGKKGPPLAPFVRIPAAPARVERAARRQRRLRHAHPPAAEHRRVEAGRRAPRRGVRVHRHHAAAAGAGARAGDARRDGAGRRRAGRRRAGRAAAAHARSTKDAAVPGATITVRDDARPGRLRAPGAAGAAARRRPPRGRSPARPAPPGALRRFYIAVAFSDRGRPGPQSTPVELPLTAVPDAPRRPRGRVHGRST